VSRAWIPVLLIAALVLFPDAAHACAVCFDAKDENRQAFLITTAFLSLLPLGLVGGAGMWLRTRSRQIDEEMQANELADS